jgi:hypothetical protein
MKAPAAHFRFPGLRFDLNFRTQGEEAAGLWRQTQPARCENTQNMPMGEQERVTRTGNRAINYVLSPRGNLLDALAADYAIPPQGPTGPCDLNFWSCAPLIFSVIPFPQVCVDDRSLAISRESASFAGSLQRTG